MATFKSILELLNYLTINDKNLPFLLQEGGGAEWIDNGKGKGNIIPSFNSYNSLYVYRGQNKRFQPCVSSLFRDDEFTWVDLIVYRQKLEEFKNLLDEQRVKFSDEIGLELNIEALAQHYGLKTIHLDVTHSLYVAAFFACCRLNNGIWEPIASGCGVFYRLPFIPYITGEIVGQQVYPRPKEQMAESVKVDIGCDFEKKPLVETYEFKHSLECSQFIFDYFNGGKDLFPYDPLALKTELIIKDNSLPISTIKRLMISDGLNGKEIDKKISLLRNILQEHGKFNLSDRDEYKFSEKEHEEIDFIVSENKKSFLGNVGFRPVYRSDL